MIQLRDYQKECLETVINEASAGTSKQLIVLPTGSGKTVVMAAIAKQLDKKTLILAHREELIQQTIDKFRLFWPEVSIGVCMAEKNEIDNQIVVASVQSASRVKRLEQLKEKGFELLMIDEAHHSIADSYQNVINTLGFCKSSGKLLLGVTATPSRQGLGETFDKIVYSRSISTMIKSGYLSPVIGRKILTSFVLNKVKISNGDFCISDLSEAVNTPERNEFITCKFKEYTPRRKAIAFCVDVQHCKDLAETFNKQGIAAKAVWGDMLSDDRKKALDDLKHGHIQIATSCGVLCEGFDEPTIDAVIMARPTKSQSLYIQSVGRGLRTYPGKENCLVLDFTDRSNNLDSVMSLSCTVPETDFIEEEKEKEEREDIDKSSKIQVLEEIDREFDILGATRFIWVSIGGHEWSLQDDEKNEIVMRPNCNGYSATLYLPNGTTKKIVSSPLPLEYCSGVCEDYARRHLKIAFADMSAPWMIEKSPPTQGQRDFLQKQGAYKQGMSKAEAALEIRKIIALKNKQRRLIVDEPITSLQGYFLKSRKINIEGMTKFQAQQKISKIKQSESKCR